MLHAYNMDGTQVLLFKYTHVCTQTWYNYAHGTAHTYFYTLNTGAYIRTHKPCRVGVCTLAQTGRFVHATDIYTHSIDTSDGVRVFSLPLLVGTIRNCRSLGELPKAMVMRKMGLADLPYPPKGADSWAGYLVTSPRPGEG